MCSHFLCSRASVCTAIALEDKHLNNKSTPSSFLLAFTPEHSVTQNEIFLLLYWVSYVSYPGYVPSKGPYWPFDGWQWAGGIALLSRGQNWCAINTILAADGCSGKS